LSLHSSLAFHIVLQRKDYFDFRRTRVKPIAMTLNISSQEDASGTELSDVPDSKLL